MSAAKPVRGSEEDEDNQEKAVKQGTDALEAYCVNLNDKARKGRIDPLIGREAEVEGQPATQQRLGWAGGPEQLQRGEQSHPEDELPEQGEEGEDHGSVAAEVLAGQQLPGQRLLQRGRHLRRHLPNLTRRTGRN
jgi:hypothetical protein